MYNLGRRLANIIFFMHVTLRVTSLPSNGAEVQKAYRAKSTTYVGPAKIKNQLVRCPFFMHVSLCVTLLTLSGAEVCKRGKTSCHTLYPHHVTIVIEASSIILQVFRETRRR